MADMLAAAIGQPTRPATASHRHRDPYSTAAAAAAAAATSFARLNLSVESSPYAVMPYSARVPQGGRRSARPRPPTSAAPPQMTRRPASANWASAPSASPAAAARPASAKLHELHRPRRAHHSSAGQYASHQHSAISDSAAFASVAAAATSSADWDLSHEAPLPSYQPAPTSSSSVAVPSISTTLLNNLHQHHALLAASIPEYDEAGILDSPVATTKQLAVLAEAEDPTPAAPAAAEPLSPNTVAALFGLGGGGSAKPRPRPRPRAPAIVPLPLSLPLSLPAPPLMESYPDSDVYATLDPSPALSSSDDAPLAIAFVVDWERELRMATEPDPLSRETSSALPDTAIETSHSYETAHTAPNWPLSPSSTVVPASAPRPSPPPPPRSVPLFIRQKQEREAAASQRDQTSFHDPTHHASIAPQEQEEKTESIAAAATTSHTGGHSHKLSSGAYDSDIDAFLSETDATSPETTSAGTSGQYDAIESDVPQRPVPAASAAVPLETPAASSSYDKARARLRARARAARRSADASSQLLRRSANQVDDFILGQVSLANAMAREYELDRQFMAMRLTKEASTRSYTIATNTAPPPKSSEEAETSSKFLIRVSQANPPRALRDVQPEHFHREMTHLIQRRDFHLRHSGRPTISHVAFSTPAAVSVAASSIAPAAAPLEGSDGDQTAAAASSAPSLAVQFASALPELQRLSSSVPSATGTTAPRRKAVGSMASHSKTNKHARAQFTPTAASPVSSVHTLHPPTTSRPTVRIGSTVPPSSTQRPTSAVSAVSSPRPPAVLHTRSVSHAAVASTSGLAAPSPPFTPVAPSSALPVPPYATPRVVRARPLSAR